MSTLQRAYRVVGEAESQIRRLIGKAVEEAEYDVLASLADLARGLREMRPANIRFPEVPTTIPSSTIADRQKRQGAESERRKVRAKYPRFFRDGESLVKVGWSKANQSEYQHKASLAVLGGLVSQLEARLGTGQLQFTMDDMLPLKIADAVVPDYQPYLCLAWLRLMGLVSKRGREGYVIRKDLSMSKVKVLWEELSREAQGEPHDD